MDQAAQPHKARNLEIDGIRGWAAFVVLCFHFTWETFGQRFPILRATPFRVVLNSHLAVCVFFVLSGDALTLPLFRSMQTHSMHRLVLSRFFRLSVPILASCLFVWALMRSSLVFNPLAGEVVGSTNWLASFLAFEPNLLAAVRYSVYGVYFDHTPVSYNPFLWTMSIEMLGSVVIFLNAYLYPYLRYRNQVLVCQVLYFAAFRSYVCLFVVGMLLGSLRADGSLAAIASKRSWRLASWLGLATVAAATAVFGEHLGTMKVVALACLSVACVYANPVVTSFFRSRFSVFLGELSFPMYLLQFPVLVSLTSWLILKAQAAGQLTLLVASSIGLLSVLASLALAWLFRLGEKRFLSALNRRISDWLSDNPQQVPAVEQRPQGLGLTQK
jgi:peptidoglycan/LPS O-acetylase OafA/YrhL